MIATQRFTLFLVAFLVGLVAIAAAGEASIRGSIESEAAVDNQERELFFFSQISFCFKWFGPSPDFLICLFKGPVLVTL